MSIYNSPYRLRPINSAAARGIAPSDFGVLAVVRKVNVYHTELRQSGPRSLIHHRIPMLRN